MNDENTQDRNEQADDWAAALAGEDDAGPSSAQPSFDSPGNMSAADTTAALFPQLSGQDHSGQQRDRHDPGHPAVQLTVELGLHPGFPIKHILQLAQGSVIELDAMAGEPMDVLVNGHLIAQGEVVVVNDKFGIRLTDIVTPSERLRRMNRNCRRRADDRLDTALAAGLRRGARDDPARAVADEIRAAASRQRPAIAGGGPVARAARADRRGAGRRPSGRGHHRPVDHAAERTPRAAWRSARHAPAPRNLAPPPLPRPPAGAGSSAAMPIVRTSPAA
jgi:flagellar motor switch protein FliN/FliY